MARTPRHMPAEEARRLPCILLQQMLTYGRPKIAAALARFAAVIALCALQAHAAMPGFWGELVAPVVQSDHVLWNATLELRSDEVFPRNTFIGRYSTSTRFKLARGWSLRAGYSSFLRGNDAVRLGWQRTLSGAVSYPLGTNRLIGSTIYEHHWLPADLGERNRLRQRVEFIWTHKPVAPWVYEDLAFENGRGLFRSRSRAGLSFDLPGAWQFRTGYQFQTTQRSTGAWPPRHAILFQLRLPPLFDLRGKKEKASQTATPTTPVAEPEEDPLQELDQQ